MSVAPKTIQIFLPGGEPQGIRVAELTTRIVQVLDVPRSLLTEFLAMPESRQVAVYFLVGKADDDSESRVYVGQTGDLSTRLIAHNREKEFWQRALILISKTNSLTQTHALFPEWHSLQAIRMAARYSDENSNGGTRPHTLAPMQADCFEIYETGQILLSTLGFPLFESVVMPADASNEDDSFFCTASGADGRGQYTPEGFVVLKGSVGRKENVPSIQNTNEERFRTRLLNDGVMRVDGQTVVF